jgi:uncharacterized repeat protein (TIGR01451 family)
MGLSTQCCASTVVTSPELVLEKQCTPAVVICDPIQYTLIVRNTGDGPANNVVIDDQLPDGLQTTDGKSTVRVNVGTLQAGEARQANFTAMAQRTGTFVNRATATGDGGLSAQAECETTVTQPVLTVNKTGPEMRYIGRPATYEITVTNEGDSPANQTVLDDTIPGGMEFVSASDGGQASGGRITWNLGTLEPGATRTVTVDLISRSAGMVQNTATARAYCTEASDSTEMEIKGVPAILLEVVDVEDPIEVGSQITYIITVTNQGTAVGTNIVITAGLPNEQDYVSAAGPVDAQVDGRTITFMSLPSLAPKAQATYRVIGRGNATGDVRFSIKMTSDQMTSPVEETESTNIY